MKSKQYTCSKKLRNKVWCLTKSSPNYKVKSKELLKTKQYIKDTIKHYFELL